jgi:hypothetical protein
MPEQVRHDGRKLLEEVNSKPVRNLIRYILRTHLPLTKHLTFTFGEWRGGADTDVTVRLDDIKVEVKYRFPDSFRYAKRDLLMECVHRTDLHTPGWAYYSDDDYLLVIFANGRSGWVFHLFRWKGCLKDWWLDHAAEYADTERPALNTNLRGEDTTTLNRFVPLGDIPIRFVVALNGWIADPRAREEAA